MEDGIAEYNTSLVDQFLDKPLPYFLVKTTVEAIWSQFGKVDVFSMENGLYIFKFNGESTRDAVLEAKIWHIANKPLILRKWQPDMQLMELSLSSILIWIKLLHLPMKLWSPLC